MEEFVDARRSLIAFFLTRLLAILLQDFLRKQERSNGTHLTFLTEGLETLIFKSYFNSWPQTAETKLYDEGREKVAGFYLLQQISWKGRERERKGGGVGNRLFIANFNIYAFHLFSFSAIFKHQGYEVKELPEEDVQSYINCRGTLKVASIDLNIVFFPDLWHKSYCFTFV